MLQLIDLILKLIYHFFYETSPYYSYSVFSSSEYFATID